METVIAQAQRISRNGIHKPALAELLGGTWAKLENLWVGECVLTPDVAEIILNEHMGINRPVKLTHADRLARDMRDGNFRLNGETIVFDKNGKLVNGQHRCTGCKLSEEPINVLVVYGVDPESFDTFDQHTKRCQGTILELQNEKSGNVLAAAANYIGIYIKSGLVSRTNAIRRFTLRETVHLINKHPAIRDSVAFADSHRAMSRLFTGPSLASCFHFLFSIANKDKAADFFEKISAMSIPETPQYSPVLILFRRLVNNGDKATARMTTPAIVEISVRSWNHFYNGTAIAKLPLNGEVPAIAGIELDDNGLPVI